MSPATLTSQKSALLQNPLVARYIAALIARPLLTKCYTAGTLTFLSEVVSNNLAGVQFRTSPSKATTFTPVLDTLKVDAWAVKMGLYDFAVSAPLGHFLNMWVQKLFAGKTSRGARLAWLLVQNFFVAPFQTFVYLAGSAIVRGARTKEEVMAKVELGFGKMLAITWMVQPTAMFVATKAVPMELWTPFFSLVGFSVGTFFGTKGKQAVVARAKRDKDRKKDIGGSGTAL